MGTYYPDPQAFESYPSTMGSPALRSREIGQRPDRHQLIELSQSALMGDVNMQTIEARSTQLTEWWIG
jgi:hypothetical protein